MGKSPNPYYLIRIIPAEGAFTKAELFRCFFAGSSIRDDLIFLEENCMKNQNTRRLVESALMIAIGTVLSELKVGSLWAFGGGLTIGSMVPLVLISHRWGIKWGTFTAFVYSLLQLILGVDNVQYATSVGMAIAIILLDYIIAYTVIGLSSMFGSSRPAIIGGVVVTLGLRFLCHFLTGWMIWGCAVAQRVWHDLRGVFAVVQWLLHAAGDRDHRDTGLHSGAVAEQSLPRQEITLRLIQGRPAGGAPEGGAAPRPEGREPGAESTGQRGGLFAPCRGWRRAILQACGP